MNPSEQIKPCSEIAPLLVFYVCGELTEQERADVEQHLASCQECRTQVAEERELHEAVKSDPTGGDWLDPSGLLLSQFRSEFAEKLDDRAMPVAKPRVGG